NESLAIAGRNLFDDEASSSNNTEAKPLVPSKPYGNTLFPVLLKDRGKLDQFAHFRFSSLTEEEGWNRIEECVQYQDDLWDNPSPPMNISSISGVIQPTSNKTPKPDAPTFAITTRSETRTRDPPYPTLPKSTTIDHAERTVKKQGPKDAESSIIRDEEAPWSSIFYQPSKSSKLHFPSRVRKQKKDDEDERLLSIFKQIHINLSFLEAMIHMPKGAKVLKDLLSHKEKLVKAASSVKISEELLEMDEDELVPIILGRPFLATERVVIDVHEGKLSLRVRDETVTFNIGKSMKLHSRDEDDGDSNEMQAISFYPMTEPVEPLEWKALENQLKPSSVEPPKLELKELPEHIEYAFLQEKINSQWSSPPCYLLSRKPCFSKF
nr:hypothetical protein [Tanacetum cinerariifolium]